MIFYDADDIDSQFIKAVLKAKNIDCRLEKTDLTSGIGDQDLLLMDTLTAVKYLDERHPVPKLFSHNPEQNARLNMFVRDVLAKAYDTKDHTTIFTELGDLPLPYKFLLGDNLTIADLVLYPILPDVPYWNDYKTRIKEQLNNIR